MIKQSNFMNKLKVILFKQLFNYLIIRSQLFNLIHKENYYSINHLNYDFIRLKLSLKQLKRLRG